MSNEKQIEKFRQAARDLECDEDEGRWDGALGKIVKTRLADDRVEDFADRLAADREAGVPSLVDRVAALNEKKGA